MNELKPCPFCGKSDSLIVLDYTKICFDYTPNRYWVTCNRCGVTRSGGDDGDYFTKEEAIKAWNTRYKEE